MMLNLFCSSFLIMKGVYTVLITKDNEDYLVYIPDIDRNTEGKSMFDAIYMARDLLGTWSLDHAMPAPSSVEDAIQIAKEKADSHDFVWSAGLPVFVDIDTEDYKRKLDTRSVKKNCTLPAWLNDKAEAAGFNFSRILQEALIEKLND